jgi:putative glycosyltransferase (TIGR04372 family)
MKIEKLKSIVRRLPLPIKHSIHYVLEPKFRKYNNFFRPPKGVKNFAAHNAAYYLYWVSYPLYLYLRSRDYKFLINNISNSPGQIVPELDYLLRRHRSGSKKKFIAIWPRSEVAMGAKIAYEKYFYKIIISDILFALILPFLIRFNKITVDSANSLVDVSFSSAKVNSILGAPFYTMGQRSFEDAWAIAAEYNKLKGEQEDYLPIAEIDSPEYRSTHQVLLSIIGHKEYAVIQLKDVAGNGTALAIDPVTYVASIKYLKSIGLNIVFGGREKMPNLFKEFGVINYSEDLKNNFYMDLILVKNAKIVISSASGFGNLPGAMNIPLVYANQWNFICPAPGKFTVLVPALFKNNNLWKFNEQIDYFYKRRDSNTKISNNIGVVNASEADILSAVKEALLLKDDFIRESYLQEKFRQKTKGTPFYHLDSRISKSFIEKYSELMNNE